MRSRSFAVLTILLLGTATAGGLACSSSASDPGPAKADTGAPVVDTAVVADTAPGSTDTAAPGLDAPAETATGDTWESFGKGFFATYCVECHTTGGKRDYSHSADVGRDAALIRCGTGPVKEPGCGAFPGPKQFPIDDSTATNPKPTDAERARLVAWIDAGAK